ncbi:MAG: hypothetical protein WDO24_26170 [Pseudomonadota bacterium]
MTTAKRLAVIVAGCALLALPAAAEPSQGRTARRAQAGGTGAGRPRRLSPDRPQARRGARGAGRHPQPGARRLGAAWSRIGDRYMEKAQGEVAGAPARGRPGFPAGLALLLVRALAGAELAGQAASLRQGAGGVPGARQAARSAARGRAPAVRGQGDRRLRPDAQRRRAGAARDRDLGARQPQGGHGRALPADAAARRRLSRARRAAAPARRRSRSRPAPSAC